MLPFLKQRLAFVRYKQLATLTHTPRGFISTDDMHRKPQLQEHVGLIIVISSPAWPDFVRCIVPAREGGGAEGAAGLI